METNVSRSSSGDFSPIHGLIRAIVKDCKETYGLARRSCDAWYRSLRDHYQSFLPDSDSSLCDGVERVKSFELSLIRWSGPGALLSLPHSDVDPSEHPGLVRLYRQALKMFWKDSTLPAVASCEDAARIRHSTGGPGHTLNAWELDHCRNTISDLLGDAPSLMDLFPKHGPGAVAHGEKGLQKWNLFRVYEQTIPYGGASLLTWNADHLSENMGKYVQVRHPITRYVEVPKDLRSNRVISCEPLEMQYLQQGLARHIMDRAQARSRGQVQFESQQHHCKLMRRGLQFATIDLSDASDNVSRKLVWNIFPPAWRDLIFALRSRFISYPTYGIVPLRSFAPMGSALCFPVESLVHYALIRLITKRRVSVYGDDLIVPQGDAVRILGALERGGLVPNVRKCCIHSSFRETCGMDLLFCDDDVYEYNTANFPVPPYKARYRDIPGLIHSCRTVHAAGWIHLARWIRSTTENTLRTKYPSRSVAEWMNSSSECPLLWPQSLTSDYPVISRFNKRYQRLEYLALIILDDQCEDVPDSYSGLLSTLWSSGLRAMVSFKPPRHRCRVKRRWLVA